MEYMPRMTKDGKPIRIETATPAELLLAASKNLLRSFVVNDDAETAEPWASTEYLYKDIDRVRAAVALYELEAKGKA